MTHFFIYRSPLSGDVTALADHLSESAHFFYRLTPGEVGALQWLGDRYSVSRVLLDALQEQEDGSCLVDFGYLGCAESVCDALHEDGNLDRVPCLDESTDLSTIVWLLAAR